MTDITMPQLGETVTEGTITKWFKGVGETIAEDEVLFEVSTDKVDSEVPSTVSGVVAEIRVPEGDTVEVGVVLAVVSADGAAPVLAAPAAPMAPATAPSPPPAAVATASAAGSEPLASAEATPQAAAPPDNGSGRLLSPVVRRLIATNALDVEQIVGTGAGGRITRSDVNLAIESGAARLSAAPTPTPATAAPEPAAPAAAQPAAPAAAPAHAAPKAPMPAPVVTVGTGDTVVPLNNIRRITGAHMVMSKATSPHVLTAVEVDFERVEKVRRAHKQAWREVEGFSLTYLPFIARAVADAIRAFPHINASVGDGELIVHGQLNLGIAVDLAFEGLLAPVVRGADGKRLRAIAREIVDLAGRARTKKLSADEIQGGTFTITNPGQYGTMMQFPLINQPQVAILSTDGVRRKPIVVTDSEGNEAIAIHSVGILALAWDHRAFDGAYVAAFMDKLRTVIETHDWEPELQ